MVLPSGDNSRTCAFSAVAFDLVVLVALAARPRAALVAENLFLRKQLALFQERKVRPRRADASTRWMLAALSQWFAWRDALVNVQADTLLRWHRQGFRLFWRWKSKTAGRPRLPNNLQALIRIAPEVYQNLEHAGRARLFNR